MSFSTDDLGVLGNVAVALGLFTPGGSPNPDWFGDPEESLGNMLADHDQRAALIAFVDEAMGGADRTTDPRGVIWLPIVHLDDPDLTIAVTVDETPAEGIHIGLGVSVRTSNPHSESSLAVPLFRAHKEGGPSVPNPILLGSNGGRIRLSTAITVTDAPPTPGQARLGAIGIDIDVPTKPGDPVDPIFGLSLTGFQLPGTASPRDIRVAADGLDELDDALLDLVLSLVKAQADAAAPNSPIAAVGGLLGLKSGDNVPDFPITQLPTQGAHALAAWVHDIVTTTASRTDWIGHLASLLGGTPSAGAVVFHLGAAELTLGLRVDAGPTGNTRLSPTLGVGLSGAADTRVEARADLFQIDLVSGAAVALPQFGFWAAAGAPGAGHRVLDVSNPVARADTLRVGLALDAARRLTFVLAADGVTLGSHQYPTLDLTSPDAVMDAVGNTVSDVASQLLAGCGDALTVVRLLLGLDAPAGITAIGLPALMTDPAAAVSGYWRDLVQAAPGAMTTVLAALRDALADATGAASTIKGTGTQDDPWRVPLIGPLELEAFANGAVLTIGVAATTSVDTLGQQCTVVTTRFGVTIAEVDLAAKSGKLLPAVEGVLSARERGVNPPRILLPFGDGAALTASGVGLRLGWSPAHGLVADVRAPNLTLSAGSVTLPIALPVIASDGTVTLPAPAWDGLEVLVGYFGELLGGFLGDVAKALGWAPELAAAGGNAVRGARLRLSDLIADPAAALSDWLPQLLMSDVGPEALRLLADLFAGSGGGNRGFIQGTGHPDDPYRFALTDALPQPVVWFPPAGLEPRIVAASDAIRQWRPGDPGLGAAALAAALQAEASVAADVNDLVDGRDVAGGLTALTQRWVGGDGRIVPPDTAPPGVTVDRNAFAVGQLLSQIDLRNLTGRVPTTTVYVAIGATAWLDAPPGRRVDLTAAGLDASMFAPPSAAVGDWFVALGGRTASLLAGSVTDGTPEQAARLKRVLDSLATVSNDVVLVAVAGAGHAARAAAEAQAAVTDLITLGTPLGPIALTAISTQPTADALRLLNRLLPAAAPAGSTVAEDADLALGRALVGSMMELVDRADPSIDLRQPVVPPPSPRAGLAVRAVFGSVTESQIRRAITAIVVAGLAQRARLRAATPSPPATGVGAGIRLVLASTSNGALSVTGDALVTLFVYDKTAGVDLGRRLRVRLRIGDRLGWVTSTPDLELRKVTADVDVPLEGTGAGRASITLHDARVFGQTWERLVLGNGPAAGPVLPEARVLLATVVQRLSADAAGTASVGLAQLLTALGIIDPAGGVAGDAVDQLVHDPAGFVTQRFAASAASIKTAANSLLGPLASSVDFDARAVRINGGSDTSGRFGWHADVTASTTGISGHLQLGANASGAATGQLNFVVDFNPLHASLVWHRAGGTTDTIAVWPNPDAAAIGRAIAAAAPSLGGHVALELMRRADETARPVIDAVLDAMGMLSGTAGDLERSIRPLAGLLADPAGWLRSAESLAANPAKIQALFDALRPLLGVGGAPGSPIPLANGVSLAVTTDGPGARLTLGIDPTVWTTPNGVTGRLAAGVGTTLTVGPSGPPVFGLDAFVGLTGAASGRQAVHTRIGTGGIELFLRPASGGDISLIPFAGLGSLAAAAEAALPFLLDKLATIPGTVGDLVQKVGDALALRSGNPKHFDGAALHAWATNPAGALTSALPSITATGLTTLAPLLDAFLPAAVSATATTNQLTVAIGDFSASWNPGSGVATIVGDGVSVPGIDRVSFTVAVSALGLNELSVTVGPAAINAGGVMLRPFVTVAAGLSPANGRRVAVGMALDDTHRFAARWLIDSHAFAFVSSDGAIATAVEATDPAQVALRVVEAVADLVAGVAIAQQPVQDLLNTAVGATTVRNLMRGVVLQDVNNPSALISGLFDPSTLLGRVHKLFGNIAGANIGITVEGLKVSFAKANNTIGLQAQLTDRLALVTGDVMLWLENDGSWIENNNPPKSGLFVGFLPDTLPLAFKPNLAVYGLGLRIGKNSGPLLDFGLTLDSIALHAFAELDAAGARSGGVQLQFSNLAVSADGAGGDNGIAQGVMRDTGPTPPKPPFSPALAIQKHGSSPVSVTLRAGDGAGPWWIAIQRGFGPLYLEQVGFGATMPNGRVERISLLMDGSVSMFGLTCAVDDLQITYITSNGDFFNPANWAIDLAGLAVSADMAGVTIAGGLLKQTTPNGIEYLGMLLGRFGVYGLTIFGGYGEGVDQGQKFTAFFAVGAINGPIGGPPAFFLMGIGGGFGINRRLIVPTDLSKFGDYPLIQALDIAAKPQNPMDQLRALGQYFPMQKGTFWFAAGLAFNSFALVDGIAVVAVQIGDGLDINLLGLARMALPRPQVALVSIEVALLVRFSSSEGVLWVQAQLTDNSWLLYPDIKLTGGFAYVIWFKGEHKGEFVFTLGGYHPEFHRDGYPEVPRLGLRWSIGSAITIKAGAYFALTSEALMAGGDFEASAHFGPAWAEVKFGANGIVYFDPFHYHVDAYARIAAGVTIDTWIFGEITISISLGARIDVSGPDFHGTATFEVGPIELTVEFGGSDKAQKQPMAAGAFIAKYLEAASDGSALAHAVVTSFGSLPSKGDKATPDGSTERPYVVVVEFGLTFTSTIPAATVTRSQAPATATTQHPPSRALGVAPMLTSNLLPVITLEWQRDGAVQTFPFAATARPFGSFPVGVWGLPQDPDNRKVPKAEMIEALNELNLEARAVESVAGPEIPYYQVEIGKRKPLPFTRRTVDAAKLKTDALAVAGLVAEPVSVASAFQAATVYLAATATPTALASLRGERQSPPLLGSLAERIDESGITVAPGIGQKTPAKVYDHFVDPPIAVGLLSGASSNLRVSSSARTTVKDAVRAWRVAPPTLAGVQADRSRSIAARLVVADQRAVSLSRAATVVAVAAPPPTAVAHAAPTLVQRTGAAGTEHLAAFSSGLIAQATRARAAAPPRGTAGATLSPGQIVVLKMPNAHADTAMSGDRPRLGVSGALARVVILGHGGVVAADQNLADGGTIEIAQGAERIVAIGQGAQTDAHAGLVGWHSGMQLAYAGWSTGIAPGCVVRSAGEPLRLHRERFDAGWVTGAELARGVSTVTTTFSTAPSTVVVVLDDPAAFGDSVDGRTLLLGLDGAHRALDAAGRERPPMLLVAENRSVLAYDVVPDGNRPVVVTIASQSGWSLVGVMGSSQIDATGAIGLVSARGLDSAIHPFASATANAGDLSRLVWMGPTRTPEERRNAKMRASARPPMSEPAAPAAKPGRKPPKRGGKRATAATKPHKTSAKTSKPAAKRRKSPAGKGDAKGRGKGRR